jgi:hypothetical protein
LLGPGEIDPLKTIDVTSVDAQGMHVAGAMRTLAELVARRDPDVLCVHDIDAGDALSLATRSNLEWAYRGAQALFWSRRIKAHGVHDRYLPIAPLRPFDRRGLLQVDVELAGLRFALFATQFSTDRQLRVRELRFARENIREIDGPAVLFVARPDKRIGFEDLGFELAMGSPDAQLCYARGFDTTGGKMLVQVPTVSASGIGGIGVAVSMTLRATA